MKLLITIVQRGKGEQVTKALTEFKADYSLIFLGEGTASNQMMAYLALENKEKDVVLSLIAREDEEEILAKIETKFKLSKKKTGIALTLPLSSINRMALTEIMDNEAIL